MAIMITVENILTQRKISTIGIKSFVEMKKKKLELSRSGISWAVNVLVSFFLIGSLHWQLPYTEQSSTLLSDFTFLFFLVLFCYCKIPIKFYFFSTFLSDFSCLRTFLSKLTCWLLIWVELVFEYFFEYFLKTFGHSEPIRDSHYLGPDAASSSFSPPAMQQPVMEFFLSSIVRKTWHQALVKGL